MTQEYKANLLRILQPLLAVLIGTLLTAAAFLFAGFASTACQCSRPIGIAFPFATILWSLRRWESVGGVLMAFQFPVYGLLVALGKTRKQRSRYALIVLAVHVVAVVLGLLTFRGS
jgi:hypothetical protein